MPKEKLQRANIVVKPSQIHGYGVFANQDFLPGDVIEECYALSFDGFVLELKNYLFKEDVGQTALPLGYGSIYNHAKEPNADYHCTDFKNHIFTFIAVRSIAKGDEILVSYGDRWFDDRVKHFKLENIIWNSPLMRAVFVVFALFLFIVFFHWFG